MMTRSRPAITSPYSSHWLSVRLAVYRVVPDISARSWRVSAKSIKIPLTNDVISVEKHATVWEEFDHVEHFETGEGVHEKYLTLAEALEKESYSI
jgi:hypothetical protein